MSNKYYKLLSNKPTYVFDRGGDITFIDGGNEQGQMGWNFRDYSVGNKEGGGVAATGWRVSYMHAYRDEHPKPLGNLECRVYRHGYVVKLLDLGLRVFNQIFRRF